MKYAKKILAVVMLFSLCFTSVPFANAATSKEDKPCQVMIPHITANCPSCRRTNTNYGYNPMFTGGTFTYVEGTVCAYCHTLVPEKQRHISTYWKDKYFFSCICGRDYTTYGDPYVTEHNIYNYN